MDTAELVRLLKTEWDINEGFFGQLGNGFFDSEGAERVLKILESIDFGSATVIDRALVTYVWYVPSFMIERQAKLERVSGRIPDKYYDALEKLTIQVNRILGEPEMPPCGPPGLYEGELSMIPPSAETHCKDRIRQWVKLLSEKKFKEAAKELAPKPASEIDSVEEIKICIGLYCHEFTREYELGRVVESLIPNVSDPTTMPPDAERFCFTDEGPDGICVLYDLPLNGEWSDLSAEFQFIPKGSDYVMALLDIHVM